ncbi:MAG: AraC family transcriptional regulator [Pseudomonadota bacterium]|nr:AraC family transcriptional regulator [Pseudomonadota bacterium]
MEYQVRYGALTGFLPLVSEAGHDPLALLHQAGLAADALQHPDAMMPVSTLVRLLNLTATCSGLESIGLQLAGRQGLEVLGVLGHFLPRHQNLQQAFTAVQRYMALHNRTEHWRLRLHPQAVAVQRYEHCYTGLDARQYHELAMANCYRLTCLLGGEDIRPLRVEFAHRPLHPLRVYRRFFAAEVVFDQEQDQLLLANDILQRPVLIRGDSTATDDFLRRLLQADEDDLVQQVATLIMQTMGLQQHSLPHIAALMNLQPRTLQRRLQQQGVVFRDLVNGVRDKAACWHLSASDMDITLLSAALGYTDVSAFSRAFRRLHGCAPRVWRRQHRK